jgi:FKBP-type peptidyl-prolyl cis-trans isomerase
VDQGTVAGCSLSRAAKACELLIASTDILGQSACLMAKSALEVGKAFLEENASKEGVVTTPSGLQYKVLRAGEGKKPKATDTVVVNYRGTLSDQGLDRGSAAHARGGQVRVLHPF